MFSSTTMASSMTIPTESVSASSVRLFSVKCIAFIRANVLMIEAGIAIAEMIVVRIVPEEDQHDQRRQDAADDQVLLDRDRRRRGYTPTGRGKYAVCSPAGSVLLDVLQALP